jgi:hypothetical protein
MPVPVGFAVIPKHSALYLNVGVNCPAYIRERY